MLEHYDARREHYASEHTNDNHAPNVVRGVEFRCESMSEPGTYHIIAVPRSGWIECSCNGIGWCSHIDATLIAGERQMVPEADRPIANIAQIMAQGRIGAPEGWQAGWRKNRKWRGLPHHRSQAARTAMENGKPLMVVAGRGLARAAIVEQSIAEGWEISPTLVNGCAFLVVPDDGAEIHTVRVAESRGVPIATYSDWRQISEPMANILSAAMRKNANNR